MYETADLQIWAGPFHCCLLPRAVPALAYIQRTTRDCLNRCAEQQSSIRTNTIAEDTFVLADFTNHKHQVF